MIWLLVWVMVPHVVVMVKGRAMQNYCGMFFVSLGQPFIIHYTLNTILYAMLYSHVPSLFHLM